MKVNFNETIKQAEQEYGFGKGEYFKVQEGANKIRLLSACIPYPGEYKGTPTFKFAAWVLDRRDGVIKPYFMPTTVMNHIGSLQLDPDYAFDEVPMPYDININAKNAGTKEVEYSVIPSPKPTPLTPEEQEALDKKMPIGEFVEKLKERQKSSPGANSSVTGASGEATQEQINHVQNLMNMKGYTAADLHDLGIPLESMTAQTYPEYVAALKRVPFKTKQQSEDVDVEGIPF